MTQETVRTLSDGDLAEIIGWAQEEIRARVEKRKRDTIAKIKELAGAVGVSVTIDGPRGRHATGLAKTKTLKSERKVGDRRRGLIVD